jgi:hypothetical protein
VVANKVASIKKKADKALVLKQTVDKTPTLKQTAEKMPPVIPAMERPDEEIPLRMRCPHIKVSPAPLCRRMLFCKESKCEAVHRISPPLQLPYCSTYLKSGVCVDSCQLPHYSYQQLRGRYTLLLKQAVLACAECAFNCKHFNPANKRYRMAKICNADFIGKCLQPICQFVHLAEVKHLGLPPFCKTFAQTGACSNRTAEKGIIHRTHDQYNATFKKCLAERERRCDTCTKQLAAEMQAAQDVGSRSPTSSLGEGRTVTTVDLTDAVSPATAAGAEPVRHGDASSCAAELVASMTFAAAGPKSTAISKSGAGASDKSTGKC